MDATSTTDAQAADSGDGAELDTTSVDDQPTTDATSVDDQPTIDGTTTTSDATSDRSETLADSAAADTLIGDGANDAADAARDSGADAAPEAGPPCPTPFRELVLPTGSATATLGDSSTSTSEQFTCASSLASSERVFELRVASRTGLTLSTNNVFTNVDTAIAIRRVCNVPATEIACADNTPGSAAGASVLRGVFEPGSYSVIVDSRQRTGGTFQLNWSVFSPAPNATCETATPLTAGVTTSGTTEDGGSSTPIACGRWFAEQVFYSINVPPNSRLALAVRNLGTTQLAAYTSDSCINGACGGGTSPALGGSSSTNFDNNTSVARLVTVGVGTETVGAHGVFSITPTITPLPLNANCDLPTALSVGSIEAGDTAMGGARPIGCDLTEPRGQFFSAVVAARSRATFTVRSASNQQIRTRLLDSCAAASCEQSMLTSAFGQQSMLIENPTDADRRYLFQVGSTLLGSTAQFTILFATTQPIAANAVCATPATLNLGDSVVADTRSGASTAVCRASRELYYRAIVPANSQAILELTRGGAQNVEAVLFDACSTATCSNLTATTSSAPAIIRLQNPTAAARAQTFSVASTSFATPTTFTLRFDRVNSLPPNAYCSAASPLALGATEMLDSTDGGSIATTQCGVARNSPERYYTLTIPARSQVQLSLPPDTQPYMRLDLLDDCRAAQCIGWFASTAVTVSATLTNALNAAQTYIVSAASRDYSNIAQTPLMVSAATPSPYTQSAIVANCDDLSSAASLAVSDVDEAVAPAQPLPFAFLFAGQSTNRFVVSTNGWAALLRPAESAPSSPSSLNRSLILNDATPPIVAPFWDDLSVSATSAIRTATFGATPNRRFVVDWGNVSVVGLPGTLRFQLKLHESTNHLEFHYCAVSDATSSALTGGGATVGIGIGATAIQTAFNVPLSIAGGAGFAYTP